MITLSYGFRETWSILPSHVIAQHPVTILPSYLSTFDTELLSGGKYE